MKIIVAAPRGFCAGVTRAVDIVERALERWGAPVYVRHEIVHNKRVVGELAERELKTVDATCPLVTKVHSEAKRFARQGYVLVYIGHAGHDEAIGTLGEAPEAMHLVETAEDVDKLD